MVTVAHPRLDSAEYLALQAAAGWRSAIELIAGEAVVTPPSGGHAASAQGELFFAAHRWQEASGDAGLLLLGAPTGSPSSPAILQWIASYCD